MTALTAQETAALGRLSDTKLANRIGRCVAEVRAAREEMGIDRCSAGDERMPIMRWANAEAAWYSHIASFFVAPVCQRVSRMGIGAQWSMGIDLAIAYAEGWASHRTIVLARMRERIVYWPTSQSPSGWLLVPPRIYGRARRLIEKAKETLHRHRPMVRAEDVAALLRRWQRSGQWRREASKIVPIHCEGEAIVFPAPVRRGRKRKTT